MGLYCLSSLVSPMVHPSLCVSHLPAPPPPSLFLSAHLDLNCSLSISLSFSQSVYIALKFAPAFRSNKNSYRWPVGRTSVESPTIVPCCLLQWGESFAALFCAFHTRQSETVRLMLSCLSLDSDWCCVILLALNRPERSFRSCWNWHLRFRALRKSPR